MAAFTDPCAIWPNGGSKLQTYLGTTIADVKTICLLESINKWSKKKPVRVAQYESLTDAQFKSARGDYGSGYSYGVRVRYIHTTNFGDLHNWTFDYGRPNDYYRLDDFYGYDKDAAPDIDGTLPDTFYRDVSASTSVYINIERNAVGVPILDIVKESMAMSGATDEDAFSHIYPFLLVGDYMCALTNVRVGAITPIVYNNAWYTDFQVDMEALRTLTTLPLGRTTPFTLFIVEVGVTNTQFNSYLNGEWINIGSVTNAQLLAVPVFPLPNAVGIYPEVKDFGLYPPTITLQLPTTASSRGFSVNYTFEETPVEDVIINFNVTLKPDNLTSVKSYTHEIDTGDFIPIAPSWSWSDFGLATAPANGTMYQVTVSATYYYASSALNVKSETETGGLTVDTSSSGGLTPIEM